MAVALALLQEDLVTVLVAGEDVCEKAVNHSPPASLDILVAEGRVLE